MYGQTNCWALPYGDYAAFRGLNGEIYVMTERSALNLSYQVRPAGVYLAPTMGNCMRPAGACPTPHTEHELWDLCPLPFAYCC